MMKLNELLKKLVGYSVSGALAALILVIMFGVIAVLVITPFYLWDEGYLGFYWERYGSTYDQKLGVSRCLDENGNLMDGLEPPCLVLTLRGRKAMERNQQACEENGGKHDDCRQEAWRWVISTRPSR